MRKERAIAAGADGFIAKPCLPDEFTRQISHAAEITPPTF